MRLAQATCSSARRRSPRSQVSGGSSASSRPPMGAISDPIDGSTASTSGTQPGVRRPSACRIVASCAKWRTATLWNTGPAAVSARSTTDGGPAWTTRGSSVMERPRAASRSPIHAAVRVRQPGTNQGADSSPDGVAAAPSDRSRAARTGAGRVVARTASAGAQA